MLSGLSPANIRQHAPAFAECSVFSNIVFRSSIIIGCMPSNTVEPFFLALILLLGFSISRARGGWQKLQNLLIVGAFMGFGLGIGFVLGLSIGNTMIGSYFGVALMWALGSIAAVGRIRKNRRFARIDEHRGRILTAPSSRVWQKASVVIWGLARWWEPS